MADPSESLTMDSAQPQARAAQRLWSTNDFKPFERVTIDKSIADRFEQ